jgi:hypothetical protein
VPQGDFRAKRFDIVHVIRGRGQRVIASVKKESALASGTALLMCVCKCRSSDVMCGGDCSRGAQTLVLWQGSRKTAALQQQQVSSLADR